MRIEHQIVTYIDDEVYKPEMVDQIEKILAHTMIIEHKLTCFVRLTLIGEPGEEEEEYDDND